MVRSWILPRVAMLPNCFRYAKFHLPGTVDDGVRFVRLVPGYQFGPMAVAVRWDAATMSKPITAPVGFGAFAI